MTGAVVSSSEPKRQDAAVPASADKTSTSSPSSPAVLVENFAADKPIAKPAELASSVLPSLSGCNVFQLDSIRSVAVCRAVTDGFWDKVLLTAPSLVVSLIAVSLSFIALRHTKRKDLNARHQSVLDDFWLRKILSPQTIEPFVKLVNEITNELPHMATNPPPTESTVRLFFDENKRDLHTLISSFDQLKVLSENLATEVSFDIEEIEDQLAVYCAALTAYLTYVSAASTEGVVSESPKPPAVQETKDAILTSRRKLMARIRNHQVSLVAITEVD